MEITRYDGTRFITEEEIDREFTGMWVLIRLVSDSTTSQGYLVASAEGQDELRWDLEDIGLDELNGEAIIIYGCETRGDSLHVQLLD
jgi:hypothetical protein